MAVQIAASEGIHTGHRNAARHPNGTLWVMAGPNQSDAVLYYSTNNGVTWNASATVMPGGSGDPLIFGIYIDSDGFMHTVSMDDAFNLIYNRGTLSGTTWSWSSDSVIDNVGTGIAGSTVSFIAHPEGTGWEVHVIYNDYNGSNWTCEWAHMTIASGGTFGGWSNTTLLSAGNGQHNPCDIDFRHNGDGMTVETQADVYLAYVDISENVLFKKLTHTGASTWSVGATRTIDTGIGNNVTCAFDATNSRIYISHDGDANVPQVLYRDEADTTTTDTSVPTRSDGTPRSHSITAKVGSVALVTAFETSGDIYLIKYDGSSWGSWALLEGASTGSNSAVGSLRGTAGLRWAVYADHTATGPTYFTGIDETHELSATLQGVGTFVGDLTRTRHMTALLQGIGRWAKARLTKVPQGSSGSFVEPDLDFTVFDGYLEGDDGVVHSLIYHEDAETKGTTAALPTRAEKQDVGTNPFEQRPEFGEFFSQGDFSHGADQRFFHQEGRDAKKFLASEGYDITEEGSLTHLHEIAEAIDSASIGAITQTDDVILVAQGTDVRVGNGLFPGTWGTEDPSGAEGAATVLDLTSRGAEVFAALGAAGVHIRSSAGSWTHFQPDAATDLVAGTATRVAWLKDRLFVVGTAGREIFEVVADSTPSAIKTLPEGWTFESIFEAGAFVYAPAVNADAGLSRVHILGLNSGATLIEDKGSVPIPRGELIYAGIGDPGGIFLGGGASNDDGGYDPVFYQAIQSENGFLQLLKITQGVGGNTDCSVLAFESLGDSIVMSWSQGSAALTGERAGIAMYHLGRQAFSQHLKKDAVSSAQVQDILYYKGRLILSIEGDGLYYEDTASFVADAYLISSIADWGGASLKVWDRVEISHGALPADTTVTVQYTTEDPSEEEWFSTIISSVDGATGASSRLTNITSRLFALKIMSTANAGGTAAPLIQSFAVRSNLTRAQPEFTMTRFVRVLAKDRKDGRGSVVYKDPVAERIALMLLLDSWVTVWEPGIIWQAFIKGVSDTEPAEPFLSSTNGEPLKEAYLIRLDMIATGEAA